MKKYEYIAYINYYHRCLVNGDIDTQTCKLMISNEIMCAWNDSDINGYDMTEILEHTDGIFQEIANGYKRKKNKHPR